MEYGQVKVVVKKKVAAGYLLQLVDGQTIIWPGTGLELENGAEVYLGLGQFQPDPALVARQLLEQLLV